MVTTPTETCNRCTRPSIPGSNRCEACRASDNRSATKRRAKRIEATLCLRCGKNPPTSKRYCDDCLKLYADLRQNEKQAAFNQYGGSCACCKEDRPVFLTIDHIEGGGNQHRKTIKTKTGNSFYRWLRQNGYPEGYRVLCWNCNCAFGLFGACPHQQDTLQSITPTVAAELHSRSQ